MKIWSSSPLGAVNVISMNSKVEVCKVVVAVLFDEERSSDSMWPIHNQ